MMVVGKTRGLEERTSRADVCTWASGRVRHLCEYVSYSSTLLNSPNTPALSQAFLLFLLSLAKKKRERESQV